MFMVFRYFAMALAMVTGNALRCETVTPKPFASNALLIFLDKSEGPGFYAVTGAAWLALEQQAAPLLMSLSLLRNIVTPSRWEELANFADIKKYYNSIDTILTTETPYTAGDFKFTTSRQRLARALSAVQVPEGYISQDALRNIASIKKNHKNISQDINNARPVKEVLIKQYSSFNQNDWVIRKVDADLVLLIPRSYITKLQQKFGSLKPKAQSFSELEALLGLSVDHLEKVSSITDLAQKYKNSTQTFEIIPAFTKLFVPRTAYASAPSSKNSTLQDYFVPTWAIYMDGHGTLGSTITGLPLAQFQEVLNFLETKINTKLLMYSSCYAAGTNADAIYNDIKTKMYKTYPFAIITNALTDGVVASPGLSIPAGDFTENDIDFKNKKLKIPSYSNSNQFVNLMMNSDTIDYTEVMASLLPSASVDIRNLSQLKLPGVPWFKVVDTKKTVASIGKVLGQTRTEPLDIVKFFQIKPAAILLYTNYIPFTLDLSGMDSMPKIISMTQGATFYIKEMIVPTSLQEFGEAFMIIAGGNVKTFLIKTLRFNENKSQVSAENVVIAAGTTDNKASISLNLDPTKFQSMADLDLLDPELKKAREKADQASKIEAVQKKKLAEQKKKEQDEKSQSGVSS